MLFEKSKKLINSIESINASFFYWIAWLLTVVFLRIPLEAIITDAKGLFLPINFFFQHPLWFAIIILSIIIVLSLFSKEKINTVSKPVLFFSFLFILVPLIDLVVSGGKVKLEYLLGDTTFFLAVLVNPLGAIEAGFISIGEGVIAFIALLLIFSYCFIKTEKLLKSLAAAFTSYFSISFFSWFPSIIIMLKGLPNFYMTPEIVNMLLPYQILFLSFSLIVLLLIWLFLYSKNKFVSLIKNIYVSRIFHYLSMPILGGLLYFHLFHSINLFSFISLIVSFFFAFQSGLTINRIFDKEFIPHWDKQEQYILAFLSLFFSLVFAFIVNKIVFCLVLSITLLSYSYSMPPFRLKRLGFINNLVIAFISMLGLWVGFFSQSTNFSLIPWNYSLMPLVVFFFGSQIKDVKDYAKDKVEGIKTLPVIFGLEKSKPLIAVLVSISFILAPIILWLPSLIPFGFLFALLTILFYNKVKPMEKLVFLLYFLLASIIAFFLVFF